MLVRIASGLSAREEPVNSAEALHNICTEASKIALRSERDTGATSVAVTSLQKLTTTYIASLSKPTALQVIRNLALTTARCFRPRAWEPPAAPGMTEEERRIAQAAAASIQTAASRVTGGITEVELAAHTLKACTDALQTMTRGGNLTQDLACSASLVAILKAINNIASESRSLAANVAPQLVQVLSGLLGFGLSLPGPRAKQEGGAGGAASAAAVFVPPHRREKSSPRVGRNARQLSTGGAVDGSASEADGVDDPINASKVRLGALACLQACVRADSSSVHSSWQALFPSYSTPQVFRAAAPPVPLLQRCPSLLGSLLHDPHHKVRSSAAATIAMILEAPSHKKYFAIADNRSSGHRQRQGFTSASETLAQVLLVLHAALLHASAEEKEPAALAACLRTLAIAISVTPYERLRPSTLPADVLVVVAQEVEALAALPPENTGTMLASALTSTAAVLQAQDADGAIRALLTSAASGQAGDSRLPAAPRGVQSLPRTVIDLCSSSSQGYHTRVEGMCALASLAKCHPMVLFDHLNDILALTEAALSGPSPVSPRGMKSPAKSGHQRKPSAGGAPGDSGQDRFAQQTLRVIEYILEALSCTGDMESDTTAGEVAERLAAVHIQSGTGEMLEKVMNVHVRLGMQHPSAMVRSAALACVCALGGTGLTQLTRQTQAFVVSHVTMEARSGTPAATQAAACKALGSIVSSDVLSSSFAQLESIFGTIVGCLTARVGSIKIAAAWSLANACDSVRAAVRRGALPPDQGRALTAVAAAHAVDTAAGNDKVRAHGLRALWHILSLDATQEAPSTHEGRDDRWLVAASQALQTALATGNAKVQWNACLAAGSLLGHPCSAQKGELALKVQMIVQSLLLLLQNSSNMKIRLHAAAAIREARGREVLGDCFLTAVQALINVSRSLDPVLGEDESTLQPFGPDSRAPAQPTIAQDELERGQESHRSLGTLSAQVARTVATLLGWCVVGDARPLRDVLLKRSRMLQGLLVALRDTDDEDNDKQVTLHRISGAATALVAIYASLEEACTRELDIAVCGEARHALQDLVRPAAK
ncbi:unnamed protein product [Pedinophyceae sp. YPF-701]|nr:unnamed protein product [Pedinophyceae sp. YPF-701]